MTTIPELPSRRRDADCCVDARPSALAPDESAAIARRLRAIAEPVRLGLLDLLAQQTQPLCVCDITPRFACGQPTVSHHLKVLREAGLIGTARRGVWSYFWATDAGRRVFTLARGMAMDGTTGETVPGGNAEAVVEAVRERYAGLALRMQRGGGCCGNSVSACGCGDSACGCGAPSPDDKLAGARAASLGCASPVPLADLHPGEIVLDLGSGGGLDVLQSAMRVAPNGIAIGVDMTDEMLTLAQRHRDEAGVANALFVKGRLESLPLPADSVDVVLSNCVVNLVPDKQRALAEAFRVLRPGGRLAIADVVAVGPVDRAGPATTEDWVGCVAGAIGRDAYASLLANLGFEAVAIEVPGQDGEPVASASVRARKPKRAGAAA